MLSFSIQLAVAERKSLVKEKDPPKSTYPENRFADPFSGDLRASTEEGDNGIPPGGRPDPNDALGTVGDVVWLSPFLGLIYGVFIFKRKKGNDAKNSW
jgi:hypothetical protein